MGNITKGPIGEEDIEHWTGTAVKTFTRTTSTGGSLTLTKVGYEVDALISYGGCINYTQATILSALAAIGTTNKVMLLLRPGTWVISSDADWSAYTNVTFRIVPGAVLQIATGTTTTFGGPIEAGTYKIFDLVGTGKVLFGSGSVKDYHPEWYGVGETIADDASFNLPIMSNGGYGIIVIGKDEERAQFSIKDDGTVNLIMASSNIVANANTDGKFCIGTGVASPCVIKNRLGATKSILLQFWYN